MAYSDFESMLMKHSENMSTMHYNEYKEMENGVHDSQILTADKSASLFDFIKMIDKLVSITMKDLKVTFIPDEGKVVYLSNDQRLDNPIITYKLISRRPKGEIKPRFREDFMESKDGKTSRVGEIYGQKFKCQIQFNIFASVYEVAEQVMERFEDLMITYAGYFKKNGVAELLFDQQYTDQAFETMRQTLSIRNISYYVEVEKLTVIMRESIKAIETY
jgi:hypothetical protein